MIQSPHHKKLSFNMYTIAIQLFLFFSITAMDNLPTEYSLDSVYIPAQLFQQIIGYVGDQGNPETKFENFKALLRCKRVNKKWKKFASMYYELLLYKEKKIVNECWEEDKNLWHAVGIGFGIDMGNAENDWEYRKAGIEVDSVKEVDHEKLYACAIKHNLIVWVFHYLYSDRRIQQLKRILDPVYDRSLLHTLFCRDEAFKETSQCSISPVMLAIYCDAYATKALFTRSVSQKKKDLFHEQILIAEHSKSLYNMLADKKYA